MMILSRDFTSTHTHSHINGAPAHHSGDDFAGIILHEKLDSRIHFLAQGVRNTRRHSAPMRHMLFYGPPGTGKSMVAKRLAVSSGLDWAIMSGGDVVGGVREG